MTTPRLLRVRSGDIELAVRCWDQPDRPTLVLVHGYPDNQGVWRAVVEQLIPHYRVLTYDVRGAGASDIPRHRRDYQLAQLSADLVAVTDALCPDQPFHLVGHDWGSIQSWESVTDPALQSRIASFTTVSGPCLDHAGFWMRRRLLPWPLRNWSQLFGQLLHSWYIYLFHLPWLMPLLWRHVIGRRWPAILQRLEAIEAQPSATQSSDGLHGIKLYRANIFQRLLFPRPRHTTIPVQAIVPLQDNYVRPGFNDDLPRWVARLWRRDIAAGHWQLLYRQPALLAGYIREFVDFIESGDEPGGLRALRIPPVN